MTDIEEHEAIQVFVGVDVGKGAQLPRDAAIPDGASRARTGDLHAASVALSQLSYGPEQGHDSAPRSAPLLFCRRGGG